jgi:glycosyltransferase involved in cell wall biosynthesis
LAQRRTGTQRYAHEIVRAIIATKAVDLVIHVPAGVPAPDWMDSPRVRLRHARVKGVVFEQLYLPLASAGSTLLNFAGPAPLMKRRQLVTMHDATPFRYPQTFRKAFVGFYLVSYYLLGRFARVLATVSQFSARELDAVLGIPAERFVVAGCAADALEGVRPVRPDLPLRWPYYLVVGTLAQHKNLVEPVTAVAESGRTIVVVGASGDQQVFSDSSPLPQQAIIAGALSDAELAWLYRNASALIFPSKYEGFGLPPLEAQTLGCPVVSSRAVDAARRTRPTGVRHRSGRRSAHARMGKRTALLVERVRAQNPGQSVPDGPGRRPVRFATDPEPERPALRAFPAPRLGAAPLASLRIEGLTAS